MHASSVNWRNKIHDNITLKKSYIFFVEILDWEIFQAICGKFRGNSNWDWGRISPPSPQKHCRHISYLNDHKNFFIRFFPHI